MHADSLNIFVASAKMFCVIFFVCQLKWTKIKTPFTTFIVILHNWIRSVVRIWFKPFFFISFGLPAPFHHLLISQICLPALHFCVWSIYYSYAHCTYTIAIRFAIIFAVLKCKKSNQIWNEMKYCADSWHQRKKIN